MNLNRYQYISNNEYFDYEVYSDGPKGKIKKTVTFTKIQDSPTIYNLAFGDKDTNTGMLNDLVISNNNDRDRVLATVAHTIISFCEHNGNHYIYAEGSTPARTRLYQIGIAALLGEINNSFDIFGLKDGILYRFERNINYDAFLVKRKEGIIFDVNKWVMAEVKKKNKQIDTNMIVSAPVRSHANDPFVVKKVEKARETLRNADLSILNK